jgi:hypothetical protein
MGSTPDNSSGAKDEKLRRFMGYASAFLDRPTDVCVTRNINEHHFDWHVCQLAVRPGANRAKTEPWLGWYWGQWIPACVPPFGDVVVSFTIPDFSLVRL